MATQQVSKGPATIAEADAAIVASEAHLAELEARMKRGEDVSAVEYGEAEMQARQDKVRRKLLEERLAEEAEAARMAAIETLRDEASSRIDRESYDLALEKFAAEAREFFEAAKAYEERAYAVRSELKALAPLPAGVGEETGGLRVGGVSYRYPNPAEAPKPILRREFRAVFPRRGNDF